MFVSNTVVLAGLRKKISDVDKAIAGTKTPPAKYKKVEPKPGATKTEAPNTADSKAAPKPEPAKLSPPAASGSKTAPTPEPAKTEAPAAEGPLTEQSIKAELELIGEGRGRAVLGSIARVGGRAFAVLKVAGTLYVIYSLTQIRSLQDAGVFVAVLGKSLVVSKIAGKLVRGGGPLPFIITFLIDLPNDQGEAYNERLRKSRLVSEFLSEHFTRQEILANGDTLRREAEQLLFNPTPFALVPTSHELDESDRQSFEQCMSEESVPPAAGGDAAEKAHNETLEACRQRTGYIPAKQTQTCTELGCTTVTDQ